MQEKSQVIIFYNKFQAMQLEDVTFSNYACDTSLYSLLQLKMRRRRFIRTRFQKTEGVELENNDTRTKFVAKDNNRMVLTDYVITEPVGIHALEFKVVSTTAQMTIGIVNPAHFSKQNCVGENSESWVTAANPPILTLLGCFCASWRTDWTTTQILVHRNITNRCQ
jgi:hypothetical protein